MASTPDVPEKELFSSGSKLVSKKKKEGNNKDAARRYRERAHQYRAHLENQVAGLTRENQFLKAQLTAIKEINGIIGEALMSNEEDLGTHYQNKNPSSTDDAIMEYIDSPGQISQRTSKDPNLVSVLGNSALPMSTAPLNIAHSEKVSVQERDRNLILFPEAVSSLNRPDLEAAGNGVPNLRQSLYHNCESTSSAYDYPPPPKSDDNPRFSNNRSLPPKLRHKSHIGGLHIAATAYTNQVTQSKEGQINSSELSRDRQYFSLSYDESELNRLTHNLTNEHHTWSSSTTQHAIIDNENTCHLKSEIFMLASKIKELESKVAMIESESGKQNITNC